MVKGELRDRAHRENAAWPAQSTHAGCAHGPHIPAFQYLGRRGDLGGSAPYDRRDKEERILVPPKTSPMRKVKLGPRKQNRTIK